MTPDELRRRIDAHPIDGAPETMRAAFERLAALPPVPFEGREEVLAIGGVETLVLTPTVAEKAAGTGAGEGADAATIVHLHGGGYVFGSPDSHRALAVTLAATSGLTVRVPRYPLAPEHPWPAQPDAVDALLDALPEGPLLLSGDSAGGHLAIVTALRRARARPPLGLLLFSPNTLRDYRLSETRRSRSPRDAMNDHDGDDALARLAFGTIEPDDPEQTLTLAALASLPPIHLDVGTEEVLLDDALAFARHAALAGVAIDLHVRAGAFHLQQLFAGHFDPADASLARAARWARERLTDR